MRSSQSRIAKIEAGDPSVSLDLIVRALIASGATMRNIQVAFTANERMAGYQPSATCGVSLLSATRVG